MNGVSIVALKKWPPADLVKLFFLWGSKVDASLLQNDLWLTAVAFMQSFILAPAALVIAYGILAGHSWVKTPALVWTGAVVYSVVLCVLHARCVGQVAFSLESLSRKVQAGWALCCAEASSDWVALSCAEASSD